MSGPVALMCQSIQPQMCGAGEFSTMFDDDLRRTMFRGIFNAYYSNIKAELIFDTNRAWQKQTALVASLYPESKIICCVREISWIVDSVEQMLNKNPLQLSRLLGFATGESVYDRSDHLMESKNGFIGRCLAGFREAWFSEHAGRLIVVPYENLVREPQRTVNRLYEALGEVPFEHDFLNVEYDEPDFDEKIGMPGLHKVDRKVEYRERQPCIPPDLFAKYGELNFWQRPEQNLRGVKII